MSASWCETLGIDPPDLADVIARSPGLKLHHRLVVALLERGEPMTLDEVAARLEAVGDGPAAARRRSLSRCRPASPPVVRVGDHYRIDPHWHDFRFLLRSVGLRRAPAAVPRRPPRTPAPVPGPEVPLSPAELDEGWKGRSLRSWSEQRVALAVLDAHGGPLAPDVVRGLVSQRTPYHFMTFGGESFGRKGSPVSVDGQGRWQLSDHAAPVLRSARKAVRVWVAQERARAAARPDPSELEARKVQRQQARAAHRRALRAERRALLVAFPPKAPEAVALLDIGERRIETFVGDERRGLASKLEGCDAIGAIDVHATLDALGLRGDWRALELGPPKKTRRLNRRGRTLKITTELLVQGSCGIHRPFGDRKKLKAYLRDGQEGKLRRRLAADVKSLHALYAYGMLHGVLRLRWGFLDEGIPAPWKHIDDPSLAELLREALATRRLLEVVTGHAPGWEEPWSRVRRAVVVRKGHWPALVGDDGVGIAVADVQAVRWADAERRGAQ